MAYFPNYYSQYPYMYQPAQSYSNNTNLKPMEWVDGEVGAKAFQMPPGLPPETPIALWDNSEKKIYLKSWNAMGMPNQLQELEYTIKEKQSPALLSNMSGSAQDPNQYVTKEDFETLKRELHDMISGMQTKTGSRGGNG